MKTLSSFLVVLSLLASNGCSSVEPEIPSSTYKPNQQVSELMKAISMFEHLNDRLPQTPDELKEFISTSEFQRDIDFSTYVDLKFEHQEKGILNVSFKQIRLDGIGETRISIEFKSENKAPNQRLDLTVTTWIDSVKV